MLIIIIPYRIFSSPSLSVTESSGKSPFSLLTIQLRFYDHYSSCRVYLFLYNVYTSVQCLRSVTGQRDKRPIRNVSVFQCDPVSLGLQRNERCPVF